MRNKLRQLGQGMTEYIIIVALIAIAAIGVYSLFGDTVTDQMGAMTQELSGGTGTVTARTDAEMTNATSQKSLATYEESN